MAENAEPTPGPPATPGRLPTGHHKLTREFVVRSQRDRLLGAMAQQCAIGGYGAATVDAVIARARVSSKTFYEQFTDREDCFLTAYDAILDQLLERVTAACRQTDLPWPERVRAVIGAVLSCLASEPHSARLCIVEVLAAGDRALERYDEAVGMLAGRLDEGRALTPDHEELPARTATDVIEGSAFLIREEILAGRTRQLESLVPDLTYVALVPYLGPREALRQAGAKYSLARRGTKHSAGPAPAGAVEEASRPAAERPPLARERQQRWREQARRERRERMLEAMIDTVAERGYHQTSMNDVAARAGVSRDTLRQQFGNKQSLFIAAHDWLLQRLANYVAPAYQRPGPWPERISRALTALLTAIAYRPQGARVAIIEVLAAGPQAHQHHLAAIEAFTRYIDHGRDENPFGGQLPPTLARVVSGAVAARIHKQLATPQADELAHLHPELVYLVLLPYLGHQRARRHARAAHAG